MSVDELVKDAAAAHAAGVPAVLLFGIPDRKDEQASGAYADRGIVQQAVRALKRELPGLLVITDVCLCEYTDHWAELSGLDADKVEIDFAGASMNMGYNRQALAPGASGHFAGEATLPVCVTGRMTWQATLMVETSRPTKAARIGTSRMRRRRDMLIRRPRPLRS